MKSRKLLFGLGLILALSLAACSGPTPQASVPQTGGGAQTITPGAGMPTAAADQAGGGGPSVGSTPAGVSAPTGEATIPPVLLPIIVGESVGAAPAAAQCPAAAEGMTLFSQAETAGSPGFCFLYPSDFQGLPAGSAGYVSLVGPAHGEGPEPARASLTITALDPAGLDFNAFVEQEISQTGMGLLINRQEATLAGEPAVVVEGLPGQVASRVVYTAHKGYVFYLLFTPLDSSLAEAQADMQRLYQAATTTWAWQ